MFAIAVFYNHNRNYDLMIKYFLMAIELKDFDSMFELGNFYKYNEKYILMKKYYIKIISNNITK